MEDRYTKEDLKDLKEDGFIETVPGHLIRIDDYKIKTKHNRWFCQDCSTKFPDGFKVKNEIWKEAGLGKGIICFYCLEKRLNRNLVLTDFEDVPLNNSIVFGYEMAIKDNYKRIECRNKMNCSFYTPNCKFNCDEYDKWNSNKEKKLY